MPDPRAANCQRFATANGLVTGVELKYLPVPSAKYELVTAELIDEQSAQGQIVARVLVMNLSGER